MTCLRHFGSTSRSRASCYPLAPRDWLPEDHLSYFISETVDELDLSGFYAPYEGDGRRNRPFDPRMMVRS